MGDIRANLFGTIAVKAGLATREQVGECIRLQREARERGEPIPRLGELMAQKGYLSPEQVEAILRGDFAAPGKRFGELCVQMRFATQEQVDAALAEQDALRKEGTNQRIGAILLRKGHLKAHQIPAVLKVQGFEIAECSKCRLTYNVDVSSPSSALKCARCGRELIMVTGYEDVEITAEVHDIRPTGSKPSIPAVGREVEPAAPETPASAPAESAMPIESEDVPLEEIVGPEGLAPPEPAPPSQPEPPAAAPEEAPAAEGAALATGPQASEETIPVAEEVPAVEIVPEEIPTEGEAPVYGEFRALQRIGQDALGVLYQAEHVKTHQVVALKVIDLERTRDKTFVDTFVAETRRAAGLFHPNIKRVLAAGRAKGHLYYASEFVAGKSVKQLLDSEGRVSTRAANRIVRAVAEGLKYAHAQGIFHGDIRPSCILVMPDGQVKLAEVGVAKNIRENLERLTRAHGVTPFYTAPELATPQGKIDARTDVFGLGATYYHMVTGKAPFEGSSPLQVLMRMAEQETVPAHIANPSVPFQVSELIKKMMAPEPDERFQSMEELIAELDRTENLQTITGAPVAVRGTPAPVKLAYSPAEARPEGVPGRPVPVAARRSGARARSETGARGARGSGERRATGLRQREHDGGARPHAARGGSAAVGLVLLLVFLAAAALVIAILVRRRQRLLEEQARPIPVAPVPQVVVPAVPPQEKPAEVKEPPKPKVEHGRSLFGPGGAIMQGD